MVYMKRILGIACVFILVISAVACCSRLFRPTKTDIAFQQAEVFHNLPENSLDVVVFGSSHAWRGVDTEAMYNEYGIRAYNYGCFWQHINTLSLYFFDCIETQTPKVILLETFNIEELLKDTDMDGEIYYTHALPLNRRKINYLKQCFEPDEDLEEDPEDEKAVSPKNVRGRFLSYFFPFSVYHSNWNSLTKESFTDSMLGEDLSRTRGYHNVDIYHGETKYKAKLIDQDKVEQKELPDDSIIILDEIAAACRERGIQIVFFTSPWVGEFQYRDAIRKYAEENGCAYINFFDKLEEAGISAKTDFYDQGHLNDRGAKKQTRYLAEYLREHYELPDVRKGM